VDGLKAASIRPGPGLRACLGAVAALASACGGGATPAGPVDAMPRACNLVVVVTPADSGAQPMEGVGPTDAHPIAAASTATLSLFDNGSPVTGAGTVTWSSNGGALMARTGPSVGWKAPTDGLDLRPRTVTVTAQTVGVPGCADQVVSAGVPVAWPDNLRTVVIYNPMQDGSETVARHYAAFRKIPDAQLCAVPYADATTVASADFQAFVETVLGCVTAVGPHVGFLAPVWGVPYKLDGRIVDTLDNKGKVVTVSLDAVLAFGSEAIHKTGVEDSPAYQDYQPNSGAYPEPVPWGSVRFAFGSDYFFVSRLDGTDAKAAIALIDRTEQAELLARAGTLSGTVYVDGNSGLPHPDPGSQGDYSWGENEIAGVESVFAADKRYPVVADYNLAEFGTAPAPLLAPDALYYAGWYAFGHYNDVFTWKTGAIGGHLDSCSACDLRGSVDWSAVALTRGITATFGAVNEPYVIGLPAYDLFFYLLLSGASFAEAGYEATPKAAWMMVFVGDPIYRPYAPR